MRSACILVVTLAVSMQIGCATEPAAPPVNLEAEKAAIQQTLRDWLAATQQPGEAGADGYAAFATEDAVVLPPNAARADGRDGVRTFALAFTEAEDWSVHWEAAQVEVSAAGDLAYALGTYEFSLTDADGNALSDDGKFADILKKQADGSWKVAVISFNSNRPLAGSGE